MTDLPVARPGNLQHRKGPDGLAELRDVARRHDDDRAAAMATSCDRSHQLSALSRQLSTTRASPHR